MHRTTFESIATCGDWVRPPRNALRSATAVALRARLLRATGRVRFYASLCVVCCITATAASVALAVVSIGDGVSEHWLVSTSGQCLASNVTNETISFKYSPEVYVRFTDYPFHKTTTYTDVSLMTVDLASPGWDHRNIALTMGEDIVVFEVLQHDHDGAFVAYTGRILNRDDLPYVYEVGRLTSANCSLYVDAEKECDDQPLLIMSVKALVDTVKGDSRNTILADRRATCYECANRGCSHKTWERDARLGDDLTWVECDDAPLCHDICEALGVSLANDGVCDDGGSALDGGRESENAHCPFATDCGDCGTRDLQAQSYDSVQ